MNKFMYFLKKLAAFIADNPGIEPRHMKPGSPSSRLHFHDKYCFCALTPFA